MKQVLLRKDYITRKVTPRQGIGMYLAKNVLKTWNEKFVDEDTQEEVVIERSEVLFERNTKVDDKLAKDVEEYGISEIEVTNCPDRAEELQEFFDIAHVKVMMKNGYGTSANIIVRSDSLRSAMDLAADYAEGAENDIFHGMSGRVYINGTQILYGIKFIGRTKEDIEAEEKAIEADQDAPRKEPFKVQASFLDSEYYMPGDKSKNGVHVKDTFVVWAYDVSTAKNIVEAWIKHEYETVIEGRESLRVVGATQFIKHVYIPAEYCNLYIKNDKLKLKEE